jgi:hypothetical protein
MTADKDDPRFDEFYLSGNELRLFIALFMTAMPSYVGLGFETRDVHHTPAPNEHYTKLYVFQMASGPKATHGPYEWGKNGHLFSAITRLRRYADAIWPTVRHRRTRWLIAPDATAHNKVLAWTQADAPEYLFLANTDLDHAATRFGLPVLCSPPEGDARSPSTTLIADWSTCGPIPPGDRTLPFNGAQHWVACLAPGEGRVYRVHHR